MIIEKLFQTSSKNFFQRNYNPHDRCKLLQAKKWVLLDKNPGLRRIGVTEVLRGIAGRAIMMLCKKEIKKSEGSLLPSLGENAGTEATIHAMKDIFADIDTNTL